MKIVCSSLRVRGKTPRAFLVRNEENVSVWNLPPSRGAWLQVPAQTSFIGSEAQGVLPHA